MTEIRTFIEENNIGFGEGERNTNVVTLIGFAQYGGVDKATFRKELSSEIRKDKFIGEEIERLWDYCKARNYAKFWKTKLAKAQYTF